MTPGEYLYSIGGFTVAGAMLEAATNKTFEQLMTEVMREVEECIVTQAPQPIAITGRL